MKVNGRITYDSVGASKFFKMATSTMASTLMASPMGLELINGSKAIPIWANGRTASNMASDCGKGPRATITWVNGRMTSLMAMEYTSGLMETGTKGSSANPSSMAKARRHLVMVMHTMVTIKMGSPVVSENTSGP